MSAGRLDAVVQAAIAEGILPLTATRPELEHRPWPVVLLIGLGAWLAAIPLLVAVGLLLGDFISRGPGPYAVGALFLAGAIVVFRAQALPVFVEQLALPALLVGGGALGFALYRDLAMEGASAALAVVAFGVATIIDRAWLRVLLGATAAGFMTQALVSKGALNLNPGTLPQFYLAWHATLALWVIAQAVRRSAFERAGNVATAAAGVAAAWIVGAFYYQLRYPLAEKALLLVAAGAVLGALAWLALREASGAGVADQPATASETDSTSLLQWGGIALALVLTLGVANVGIWQKEDVIARGQPVFVELAPLDPRSLMQGDYMRLDFRLPGDIAGADERLLTLARPRVVARRDPGGVAVLLRIEQVAGPLAPDEIRIELTPKNGRWILVTDAWFFREGDAERWAKARYGEFRVDPEGRALLVGMADRALQPIRP